MVELRTARQLLSMSLSKIHDLEEAAHSTLENTPPHEASPSEPPAEPQQHPLRPLSILEEDVENPDSPLKVEVAPTASSGYHSGGLASFLASSTPSVSPTTFTPKGTPKSVEEATIAKLRQEIEALKGTFMSSQKRWSEVTHITYTISIYGHQGSTPFHLLCNLSKMVFPFTGTVFTSGRASSGQTNSRR